MGAHTPGPWVVDPGSLWIGSPTAGKKVGFFLTSVFGVADSELDIDIDIANATLAAAAPELLETVKALRESLVSAGVPGVSARIRSADELISRIEGA